MHQIYRENLEAVGSRYRRLVRNEKMQGNIGNIGNVKFIYLIAVRLDLTESSDMQKEQRSIQNLPTVTGRTVSGYAALFNTRSQNLGTASAPWFEVLMPGSLPDLTKQDCRALMNHDSNKILARSKLGKGTLSLSIDSRGLKYSFLAPNSTVGNDLIESLTRKDIDQSSFSFIVEKDNWIMQDGIKVRQIVKIKSLLDISPVVFPAYAEATSQVRSKQTTKPDFAAIHKLRAKLLK